MRLQSTPCCSHWLQRTHDDAPCPTWLTKFLNLCATLDAHQHTHPAHHIACFLRISTLRKALHAKCTQGACVERVYLSVSLQMQHHQLVPEMTFCKGAAWITGAQNTGPWIAACRFGCHILWPARSCWSCCLQVKSCSSGWTLYH